MALVYPDSNAYALCAIPETYNISGTNNALTITIDGGSAQNFTLSSGATQTAANIVSNLSALTGATASVIAIGSVNYVQIKTTSALGASSTILFGAPANNAAATLGWFLTNPYHGGAYCDGATAVTGTFTGATKANIINGIETALLHAGWVTVSGSGTTNLLMQCSVSAASGGSLMGRIRVKDNSGTCATVSIENISGGKASVNSTSGGFMLNPGAAKTFHVLANKHNMCVFTSGSTSINREFLHRGDIVDSRVHPGIERRVRVHLRSRQCLHGYGHIVSRHLPDLLELGPDHNWRREQCHQSGHDSQWKPRRDGEQCLHWRRQQQRDRSAAADWRGGDTINCQNNAAIGYQWHDGSADTVDPILAFEVTSLTAVGKKRGLLYGAAIVTDSYVADQTDTFNSHNWWFLTNSNGGQIGGLRGCLILATS